MSEQLLTCPKCKTHGFTKRGLTAHKCDGQNRNPSLPRPAAPQTKAGRSSEQTKAAPGTLTKAIVPAGARPVTLTMMDEMPAAQIAHPRLADMTTAQLGVAVKGLDLARSQYESLSGACATLAGLVLIEAKKRLKHGEYLPWLKGNLGKSRETASLYVTVAKEFVKCQPKLTFEQMTLALMDGAQAMSGETLDMTNPMVSAVAKWTDGRTFYELKQKYAGPSKGNGGDNHPDCPHCGKNVRKTDKVCRHCGGELEGEETDPEKIREANAQSIFLKLTASLFAARSDEEAELLLMLPLTTDEPAKVASLSHLRDELQALSTLVERAITTKRKAARK